jgi:hypothetical protein
MGSNRITFKFSGKSEDNGDLRFEIFIAQLEIFEKALRATDRAISQSDKGSVYYRVVNLTHNSPATIELEAVPLNPDTDNSEKVINSFISTIKEIQDSKKAPEKFDPEDLQAFHNLTDLLSREKVSEIAISNNGTTIPLKLDLAKNVDQILGPDEFERGSITGMLEGINLHNEKNIFYLYPPLGGRIKCFFKSESRELSISALDKYVTVYGILKYKRNIPNPFQVLVEDIEILVPDTEHNNLNDLRGVANGALEGNSVEDYLWDIRNEWE